jgi:hypothetical protein
VYNESSGLKIAYLSGIQIDGPSSSKKDFQFNYEDVKNLQIRLENESGLFKGVDILLTSQWPAGVDNLASAKPVSIGYCVTCRLSKDLEYDFVVYYRNTSQLKRPPW